jgi:hypothetical protein
MVSQRSIARGNAFLRPFPGVHPDRQRCGQCGVPLYRGMERCGICVTSKLQELLFKEELQPRPYRPNQKAPRTVYARAFTGRPRRK